jgi:predicted DNA-binding transcriptional regulator YafY
MDRHERLELVLTVMRDRPGITATELAREFEVSRRTLFRDLEYLRRRGYPIEGEPGRGGGVRVDSRWSLGKVQLAPSEGICVLLSLAIHEKLGLPVFSSALKGARRKITSAFPEGQRRLLARLQERLFVGSLASEPVRNSYKGPWAQGFEELQAAFVHEQAISFLYRDEGGRLTQRIVEPHALLVRWPVWYLAARDLEKGVARLFRIDRMNRMCVDVQTTFHARPQELLAELDLYPGPSLR